MGRHNRQDTGVDQCGCVYEISYPPGWLDRIRVTRRLPGGRRSTKTMFRNPARTPSGAPGERMRTRVECAELDLVVEVALRSDPGRVRAVEVEWQGEGAADPRMAIVRFSLIPFRLR